MAEFFEGFEFVKFTRSLVKFEVTPYEGKDDLAQLIKEVDWKVFLETGKLILNGQVIEPWTPRSARREFLNQLQVLDREVKTPPLTMAGRGLHFVTPDMVVATEREKELLTERYGSYPKDSAASCKKNNNGIYSLRIGKLGREGSVSKDDVLSLIAHEYGHTIGKDMLEDPIFEELKAMAFSGLFMRSYYGLARHVVSIGKVETVHDEATSRLEQLVQARIPEEAILAHLSRDQFGAYGPEDYRKLLTN